MYFQSLPHSDPALLHIITTLSQHTLNTLHLHGFHTYLEHLKPEDIVPIFLPIYQFLSPASQERYREITTSSSWEMFPEPVSVPPPTNHSFISSSSSLIPSLASRIFSCSASPTNTFIPKIGRSKKNICKIRSSMFVHLVEGLSSPPPPKLSLTLSYFPCESCHRMFLLPPSQSLPGELFLLLMSTLQRVGAGISCMSLSSLPVVLL